MFKVNTYASIMASEPDLFQNETVGTMSSAFGVVGAGVQAYEGLSNLSGSYSGAGQQAQSSQASAVLSKGQRILTAANQLGQTFAAGGQQLRNAKARLVMITRTAQSQGFQVLPTGTVIPGKVHITRMAALKASENYAELARFKLWLTKETTKYNGQIQLVVFQTNAADAQVALTVISTSASILGELLPQKDSSAAASAQTGTTPSTAVTQPGALAPTTSANTIAGGTPATDAGTGAGLAGASALGLTGAGGSPLAGVTGLNTSTPGGTAGLAPGAVAGRGGVAGGTAAGGAMGMGPGMMYGGAPMGGGGHMGGKEHRNGNDWLDEDAEYQTADAPNEAGGVVS